MIKELEKKYKQALKGTIDINVIEKDLKRLEESIVQVITLMTPKWCEKVTGLGVSSFYDFIYSVKNKNKVNKWSIEKQIKMYNLFLKELNNHS